MFNLVRNALEALANTSDARVSITTSATNSSEGKLVQLCVSDNGPGVDDKMLGELFAAFITSKPGGMGVGLSICKSIIDDHGGDIRAGRNADSGMCFTFTLSGTLPGADDV